MTVCERTCCTVLSLSSVTTPLYAYHTWWQLSVVLPRWATHVSSMQAECPSLVETNKQQSGTTDTSCCAPNMRHSTSGVVSNTDLHLRNVCTWASALQSFAHIVGKCLNYSLKNTQKLRFFNETSCCVRTVNSTCCAGLISVGALFWYIYS